MVNSTRFILYTMFIAGGVSSLPEIISNVQRTLERRSG